MKQAAANPADKFRLVFGNVLETLFVERMEQNEEMFGRYMNDPAFQKIVAAWLSDQTYLKLRKDDASPGRRERSVAAN